MWLLYQDCSIFCLNSCEFACSYLDVVERLSEELHRNERRTGSASTSHLSSAEAGAGNAFQQPRKNYLVEPIQGLFDKFRADVHLHIHEQSDFEYR